MGLDAASVKFPSAAKAMGVNFANTAMIGRQTFWRTRKACGVFWRCSASL